MNPKGRGMLMWLLILTTIQITLSQKEYCQDIPKKRCRKLARQSHCERPASYDYMRRYCTQTCKFPSIIKDEVHFTIDLCADSWDNEQRLQLISHQEMNQHQPSRVPKFTVKGYSKRRIPEYLFQNILDAREEALSRITKEKCQPGLMNNCRGGIASYYMPLPQWAQYDVQTALHSMLESWIGDRKLEHTSTYGIRRYLEGHQLYTHLDIVATHVVSATLNVAQITKKDWPLWLVDNQGAVVNVTINPGEMVFYEGARVIHGRPEPFEGEFCDNIFVHYAPVDWHYSDVEPGAHLHRREEL